MDLEIRLHAGPVFVDKEYELQREVVALGQNVRSAEVGDRVLFSPEDRYEVEVGGTDYIMLRERDIHAVAATRIESGTGLYL